MSVIAEMAEQVRASDKQMLKITDALEDIALDNWWRAHHGNKVHQCFDAFDAGDDAQFGHLLAKELRLRMQKECAP